MRSLLRSSATLLLLLTLITGVLYPLVVTGASRVLFPAQSRGGVITVGGRDVGAVSLGQAFRRDRYLIGRPSATSPIAYNGAASSGSNLGPTSAVLDSLVRTRIAEVRAREHLDATVTVPVDLVTASGSGLDPHISPASAAIQTARIAHARGISDDSVRRIVARATTPRLWGVVGEGRVNVLLVNLLLNGAPASSIPLP